MSEEIPVAFTCENDFLAGVLHRSEQPVSKRGFVIVVAGGPQYRAGAHRQFVLLARKLAANGYPVLRFDLRGMGDSGGNYRGFEDSASDIRAAIDTLRERAPEASDITLFGECESASGALFYAFRDDRVDGLVLVNPWVRTEQGQARTYMKHYYLQRITSKEFWKKVARFEFNPLASLRSFAQIARRALTQGGGSAVRGELSDEAFRTLPLPERTAAGFKRFSGRILIIVSGRDYIAKEFDDVIKSTEAWRGLLDRDTVERQDLEEADHTFSRDEWRERESDLIVQWLGAT